MSEAEYSDYDNWWNGIEKPASEPQVLNTGDDTPWFTRYGRSEPVTLSRTYACSECDSGVVAQFRGEDSNPVYSECNDCGWNVEYTR